MPALKHLALPLLLASSIFVQGRSVSSRQVNDLNPLNPLDPDWQQIWRHVKTTRLAVNCPPEKTTTLIDNRTDDADGSYFLEECIDMPNKVTHSIGPFGTESFVREIADVPYTEVVTWDSPGGKGMKTVIKNGAENRKTSVRIKENGRKELRSCQMERVLGSSLSV